MRVCEWCHAVKPVHSRERQIVPHKFHHQRNAVFSHQCCQLTLIIHFYTLFRCVTLSAGGESRRCEKVQFQSRIFARQVQFLGMCDLRPIKLAHCFTSNWPCMAFALRNATLLVFILEIYINSTVSCAGPDNNIFAAKLVFQEKAHQVLKISRSAFAEEAVPNHVGCIERVVWHCGND